MKRSVEAVRWIIAMCLVMPMALLASGAKYLHDLLNGVCKKHKRSGGHYDEQLFMGLYHKLTRIARLGEKISRGNVRGGQNYVSLHFRHNCE